MDESKILNGKQVAQELKDELKIEVDGLKEKKIFPKLAVIMVGNDPASKVYVKNKSKACEKVGIEYVEYLLDENISEQELFDLIDKLNLDASINGILLQSPIPMHLDQNEAFKRISPIKDVDGFNPINVGNLSIGNDCFISCTPFGVMKILEYYGIELEGKNAVVLGRSNIVGKPMVQCLLSKNATVTVCHSRTKNLKEITKSADILVSAIGKPKFVTADMVKAGAVVIDVGINRTEGSKTISGDVDTEEVSKVASKITPVPGGVGPMTIAMLMYNLVKATKLQNGIK
jgi:methylenetetrahydrofolate dehydrogenase (NADP+)/methenyltetrahydrofolate cyclohydrolase